MKPLSKAIYIEIKGWLAEMGVQESTFEVFDKTYKELVDVSLGTFSLSGFDEWFWARDRAIAKGAAEELLTNMLSPKLVENGWLTKDEAAATITSLGGAWLNELCQAFAQKHWSIIITNTEKLRHFLKSYLKLTEFEYNGETYEVAKAPYGAMLEYAAQSSVHSCYIKEQAYMAMGLCEENPKVVMEEVYDSLWMHLSDEWVDKSNTAHNIMAITAKPLKWLHPDLEGQHIVTMSGVVLWRKWKEAPPPSAIAVWFAVNVGGH